jgi:hypothetical protein
MCSGGVVAVMLGVVANIFAGRGVQALRGGSVRRLAGVAARGSNRLRAAKGGEPVSGFEELRLTRIAKADSMREAGVNPFDYSFESTRTCAELTGEFESLEPGAVDEGADEIIVRGRVMAKRVFGKNLAFFVLRDETGEKQLLKISMVFNGGPCFFIGPSSSCFSRQHCETQSRSIISRLRFAVSRH